MPEIEIRPATAADLPLLAALDPNDTSQYVWQMEVVHQPETGQADIRFRQVRLPRSVRVEYPRSASRQALEWPRRSELLAATLDEKLVGYASLALDRTAGVAWIADLVVHRPLRRKGIGSGLVIASSDWAISQDCYQVVLEMQPKNHPAIQMALKLGFEFCGYNDIHYGSHGIGIFFRKSI